MMKVLLLLIVILLVLVLVLSDLTSYNLLRNSNLNPDNVLDAVRHGVTGLEIDVSWDYDIDGEFSGWGNATRDEMNMDPRVENGELRASIFGKDPSWIESPQLYLDITNRHYVVIRMMYFGSSISGNLFLRSGTDKSYSETVDPSRHSWTDRQAMQAVDSSPSTSASTGMSKINDNNQYTYYESTKAAGVYITFDLKDPRYVSTLKILTSGDINGPRECLLQASYTSGVGPFKTVAQFTLDQMDSFVGDKNITGQLNSTMSGFYKTVEQQVITNFRDYSRYWRILILNNYGGSTVRIREISFEGYDEYITPVPFQLENTGKYKNYYIPINNYFLGKLLRMKLQIERYFDNQPINQYAEGLHIDYIRIARAPEMWRVRGCLDKYYMTEKRENATYDVTSITEYINGNLPIRSFIKNEMLLPYATTYDCPTKGNVHITVEGKNFGREARIFINGNECPVIAYSRSAIKGEGRIEKLVCNLPSSSTYGAVNIRVQNGILPGLFEDAPYFAYRAAPPVPDPPIVTNLGAHKVDLVWSPPGNEFDNMATTGYKIIWFQPQFRSRVSNLTVGNVTTTSVKGLEPATEYVFAIAAMSEGAYHEKSANLDTDLYGRRNPVNEAFTSTFSIYTNITATTLFDFDFQLFDNNATLNSSFIPSFNSLGPTGIYGSEGHFGLVLVGNANIQNCNVSSTCCDGYNATLGVSSCRAGVSVCAVLNERQLAYDFVINGITRRQVQYNIPYSTGGLPEIVAMTLDELIASKGADLPSRACGPGLRLTPSEARQSGASWYRRKVNVQEGFDTTITFEISNPSFKCNRMDDVNTYCRSRGADGFAFVVQNVGWTALGDAGKGLGYEGIFGALAIEVDTYHNYDQMDYYENHVSVMTQGFRYNITANHSRSLATSNRVPDLTDGRHTIRIKYDPNFDENAVFHPSFQVNGYTTWFLENGDFQYGGQGDWGPGFGMLYVYLDDMYSPVITCPMNLAATLDLDNGRAIVGLTAATGDSTWQTHDIIGWQFTSLYIDQDYTAPLIVNGVGDHHCRNESVCVHQVDYNHYYRKNNKYGKGISFYQHYHHCHYYHYY